MRLPTARTLRFNSYEGTDLHGADALVQKDLFDLRRELARGDGARDSTAGGRLDGDDGHRRAPANAPAADIAGGRPCDAGAAARDRARRRRARRRALRRVDVGVRRAPRFAARRGFVAVAHRRGGGVHFRAMIDGAGKTADTPKVAGCAIDPGTRADARPPRPRGRWGSPQEAKVAFAPCVRAKSSSKSSSAARHSTVACRSVFFIEGQFRRRALEAMGRLRYAQPTPLFVELDRQAGRTPTSLHERACSMAVLAAELTRFTASAVTDAYGRRHLPVADPGFDRPHEASERLYFKGTWSGRSRTA